MTPWLPLRNKNQNQIQLQIQIQAQVNSKSLKHTPSVPSGTVADILVKQISLYAHVWLRDNVRHGWWRADIDVGNRRFLTHGLRIRFGLYLECHGRLSGNSNRQ